MIKKRIDESDVIFKREEYAVEPKYLYTSRLGISYNSVISSACIAERGETAKTIENHIRKEHIHTLDDMVYGRIRKEVRESILDFMTLLRVSNDRGYTDSVCIPKSELYRIEDRLHQLIMDI